MMVEGNLSALTLSHAETASYTGAIAALGASIAQLVPLEFRYKEVYLIGLSTMFADYFVHPSHFGGKYGEAILTGLGAALLAFFWEKVTNHNSQIQN